jgi:adenylate kinase
MENQRTKHTVGLENVPEVFHVNCHDIIAVVAAAAAAAVVVVVVKIIRNKTQERVRKKENKVHKLQVELLLYTP